MSTSIGRVEEAAASLGLAIEVRRMDASTRTAEEAASACGCHVGQIVKSLVFQGSESGTLILLLVSGEHRVDSAKSAALAGETLDRADPKHVRAQSGFAIGGVAPIGHLAPMRTLMDERLLDHDTVWAAAGAPDAVFSVNPKQLARASGAEIGDLAVPLPLHHR